MSQRRKSSRGFFLPHFAVARPVTVAMLLVASLVIGAVAYQRIPLELLPSGFTPPFLYVTIPTVPSTPSDVEEDIVDPVESILRTVRNVDSVRSRAKTDNAGFFVAFADGTDMTVAYNQVRDRLERVRPQLPEEVERFMIWKFDPSEDPLMFVGVRVDDDTANPDVVIDDEVVRPLERLPEISRVETYGLRPREIEVEVDDKRANAAGVSVAALIRRLQQDNFTLSAGAVDEGAQRYPLRVLGKIGDVGELRELPIGNGLVLSDVARVGIARAGQDQVYRIGGHDGYIVAIYKESTENTVDTSAAVRDAFTDIRNADPRIHTDVFFDQGKIIQGSIDNLLQTAFWGGLFAILILFVFLRRLRMTLVTATAIPLCMLVTLTVMYFSGETLNALSLMGLMLSVGMVVDNSIVVTEAIQRRRMLGESIKTAAAAGAAEVGLAIVVATGTTVVVFLPMVLMSGSETISFYLAKIGFPVCVALIASLVVSLVFIPLSLTWFDTQTEPPKRGVVESIQEAYGRALRWCLRNRGTAVLLIAALMATVAYPLRHMERTDRVQANINDVRVRFDFDPASTFDERVDLLTRYEHWIDEHQKQLELRTYMTQMGGMHGHPQIRLFLLPIGQREMTRKEIIEKLRKGLPHYAGGKWRIGWGSPGNNDQISVELEGPDSTRLRKLAESVASRLRHVDGVVDILVGEDDARGLELRYSVDPDAARRAGVTPLVVGGAIDYALRGRRVGSLELQDEDVPLWVRTDPETAQSRETLDNLALPSPLGGPGVPIGVLTSTKVAPGYNEITHLDGRTQIELQVVTTRQDLRQLGAEIDASLATFELPRGYNVRKGERFRKIQTDDQDRQFALALAIVFVFLLMGVLFESFALPLVIVMSIPFAFLGVYWMLFLTGTPFDVMAGVGLIILVGIVVNNAIVLVDRVNVLIDQRGDREDALVEAGMVRLRPIVMTALTTIGGLVPMAIGASQIVGVPYAPLGRTVIGGLLASTVLTLFVVPVFFTLVDDVRHAIATALTGHQHTD